MNRVLGTGAIGGLIANIGSNLNLINEVVGIIAGLVSISCALIILVWKRNDRHKKNE